MIFRRKRTAAAPAPEAAFLGFGDGLRLLPLRDRLFFFYELACAVTALVVRARGLIGVARGESSVLVFVGSRPWLLGALALAAAAVGLLVWERPSSWSPAGYARQLRERVVRLRATRDASFGRRYHKREVPREDPP